MNGAAALVTLKQHRFEVAIVVLGALALAAWALLLEVRLAALSVPFRCIDNWLNAGAAGRPDCARPMDAWGGIVGVEGTRISEVMRVLPFAAGLLAGVPIVGQELEAHTAQTAWSLNGSRRRWLIRQIVPIGALVFVAAALASLGATAVDGQRAAWGEGGAVLNVGLSGIPALARVFASFGLGIFLGALMGRSVPALVLGALLSFALVVSLGVVRDRWLASQEAVPIEATATSITTAWAWRMPTGELISNEAAFALVPPSVSELDDGEVQPVKSLQWLEERGFVEIPLGVPQEVALGWARYDVLTFLAIGAICLVGTGVLIDRRRPV